MILAAALARKPKLILVDELAHTNVEGSLHAKRWQDVEELLEAGIDVWTTLNVQHIESLNDVIAQITGVVVRETLPDAVLERADEIELIDLTPDELALRLRAGKVYLPAQAERALGSFFQKGNLVALRELSLRQAAQRLHQDVEAARHARSEEAPWATTERLLVCVGPSPSSAKIIRTAKRMAAAFGAQWIAVGVDTGRRGTSDFDRQGINRAESAICRAIGGRDAYLDRPHGRRCRARIRPGEQCHERSSPARRPSRGGGGGSSGRWSISCWRRAATSTSMSSPAKGARLTFASAGEIKAPCRFDGSITRYSLAVVAICGLAWAGEAYSIGWPEANTAMIFLAGVAFVATRL